MFVEWWKFTTKNKFFGYMINIYFKFSKDWIRFMMISKIEFKCFQIDFGIVYVWKVEIIRME